jgi:hypothetical protein
MFNVFQEWCTEYNCNYLKINIIMDHCPDIEGFKTSSFSEFDQTHDNPNHCPAMRGLKHTPFDFITFRLTCIL